MSDEAEHVEVATYGANADGAHVGRLETYTVGGRTREDELRDALNAANDRIAQLERELNEARAGRSAVRRCAGRPGTLSREGRTAE
jgi:hypothetical protein